MTNDTSGLMGERQVSGVAPDGTSITVSNRDFDVVEMIGAKPGSLWSASMDASAAELLSKLIRDAMGGDDRQTEVRAVTTATGALAAGPTTDPLTIDMIRQTVDSANRGGEPFFILQVRGVSPWVDCVDEPVEEAIASTAARVDADELEARGD